MAALIAGEPGAGDLFDVRSAVHGRTKKLPGSSPLPFPGACQGPGAWFVLVALAVASLLTGIVQSLGTTWGLF